MAKKAKAKLDKKPAKKKAATSTAKEEVVEMEAVAESEANGIIDQIEKNRFILISAAVVIFGLICLYVVGKQIGKDRHIEAGQAYTTAASKKSIEELDKVIAEYKGSNPAGNALLTKATIEIDAGKAADAEATLTTMANEYTQHPRHPQAYFMLGNLYQDQGNSEKAESSYQKVLELQSDGELTPISMIRLGDLELAKGNSEKASQHYNDCMSLGGNPFFGLAERRLKQINLTMPTEIDRPAAPAAEGDTGEKLPAIQPEEVKAEVEVEE